MKYVLRIAFEEETDDTAKQIVEEVLNEVDSLAIGDSAKGILFYEDGETRVP